MAGQFAEDVRPQWRHLPRQSAVKTFAPNRVFPLPPVEKRGNSGVAGQSKGSHRGVAGRNRAVTSARCGRGSPGLSATKTSDWRSPPESWESSSQNVQQFEGALRRRLPQKNRFLPEHSSAMASPIALFFQSGPRAAYWVSRQRWFDDRTKVPRLTSGVLSIRSDRSKGSRGRQSNSPATPASGRTGYPCDPAIGGAIAPSISPSALSSWTRLR